MADRVDALDFIRGFAVLGILLANITAFAHNQMAYYWPPALPGGASASDAWIWLAQFVIVDGKMRSLFAMLFGAGLVLMADRMAVRGGGEVGLQVRRLFWLALFGIAHYLFLFSGDILFIYALAGLVALFALSFPTSNLLVGGALWSIAGSLFLMTSYGSVALIEWQALEGSELPQVWPSVQDYWQERLADSAAEAQIVAQGTYADIVRHRVAEGPAELASALRIIFIETIPVILLGMGLYRAGLFTDAAFRAKWRGLAWLGVVVGAALLLACGYGVMRQGFPIFLTQFVFFGVAPLLGLPLILGAILLLTDWAIAARDSWLGERLALAGRMAFTNYVGTSLVMMLIFEGWAGGLFGTMGRAELLLVVLFGWALMLTFSRVWLGTFRYGPLEWLWRCLTYGRLFPIRRAA